MTQTLSDSDPWGSLSSAYRRHWLRLNQGFFEAAAPLLPLGGSNRQTFHLAGCGAGDELDFLLQGPWRSPSGRLLLSDLSPGMLREAEARHGSKRGELQLEYAVADLANPPLHDVDSVFTAFTLHLVRDSLAAGLAQCTSLAAGGHFAALYFPPTPIGDGPLAALHKAARALKPRPDSAWESELADELKNRGFVLERHELATTWHFGSLLEFRSAMETLPHILGLRQRAGDQFYEALWRSCLQELQGGLTEGEDGRWHGPVQAVLLMVEAPGSSRP